MSDVSKTTKAAPPDWLLRVREIDAANADAQLSGCGFLVVHPGGRFEHIPANAVAIDMAVVAAYRAKAATNV